MELVRHVDKVQLGAGLKLSHVANPLVKPKSLPTEHELAWLGNLVGKPSHRPRWFHVLYACQSG